MSVSSEDAVAVAADVEVAEVAVEADDDGSVIASVVVDDVEEDAVADAVVAAVPVPVVETPKKKRVIKRRKKSTGSTTKAGKASKATKEKDKKGGGSTAKQKKRKKKAPREETTRFARISNERLNAATAAREMLIQTVPRLPVPITDTHVVRSFGQLQVEGVGEPAKFATANALYPVGFSCDRYEFSPVHGRVLKMRCSILDGSRIRKNRAQPEDIPDGPVFRVMWGQGIDEDCDKIDYPYDPYSNSTPLTSSGGDDAVAIPAGPGISKSPMVAPEAGMRVKVRFDQDQFYYGTIDSVVDKDADKPKRKKRKSVDIKINYDDGSSEVAVFPDPDIVLVMPGRTSPANSIK